MMSLLGQNKGTATSAIASLLINNLPTVEIPEAKSETALPLAKWLLDDGFSPEFRDSILNSYQFMEPSALELLSQDDRQNVARYAGKKLLERAASRYTNCEQIKELIEKLNSLSSKAAAVFAWQASHTKVGGYEQGDTNCIQSELEKATNGKHPEEANVKFWLGAKAVAVAND